MAAPLLMAGPIAASALGGAGTAAAGSTVAAPMIASMLGGAASLAPGAAMNMATQAAAPQIAANAMSNLTPIASQTVPATNAVQSAANLAQASASPSANLPAAAASTPASSGGGGGDGFWDGFNRVMSDQRTRGIAETLWMTRPQEEIEITQPTGYRGGPAVQPTNFGAQGMNMLGQAFLR